MIFSVNGFPFIRQEKAKINFCADTLSFVYLEMAIGICQPALFLLLPDEQFQFVPGPNVEKRSTPIQRQQYLVI